MVGDVVVAQRVWVDVGRNLEWRLKEGLESRASRKEDTNSTRTADKVGRGTSPPNITVALASFALSASSLAFMNDLMPRRSAV